MDEITFEYVEGMMNPLDLDDQLNVDLYERHPITPPQPKQMAKDNFDHSIYHKREIWEE